MSFTRVLAALVFIGCSSSPPGDADAGECRRVTGTPDECPVGYHVTVQYTCAGHCEPQGCDCPEAELTCIGCGQ